MRALIAAALVALATPALAEPVELSIKLRNGATWTQTSVHTRTDVRGGVTKNSTATSVVRATYQEGDVGTVRLDFVSFEVEGADADARRDLAEQAQLIYPAVLEVDESLQPTLVRGWDGMRAKIFEILAASMTDTRALEAVKASFAKDGVQAAALFKEQGLVALGQGTGLEPGETRGYDSEVPNILGGPPIKASGAFRLESVDEGKGRAVVTWNQTPDPASMEASLKVSMEAMLSRISPEKQSEARSQFSGLTLERNEGCRYEIDMATGLATTADCTVNIRSGLSGQAAQRIDRWVITQTLPEKR